MGLEPEGSDSEVCNTFKIPDDGNTFKIPDVPKPNTGADDVADWAAEVIYHENTIQRRIAFAP